MKRLPLLCSLLLCLLGGLAHADHYVVCYRTVAMGGINQFGEQASCIKCSNAFLNTETSQAYRICPGGLGVDFRSREAAFEWMGQLHLSLRLHQRLSWLSKSASILRSQFFVSEG